VIAIPVKYLHDEQDDHRFGRPSKARLFCLIPEIIIVASGTTMRDYVPQHAMNERPMKSVGDRL
jgi:hypothetical protein